MGDVSIFLLPQFWNAGVHHGASQKWPHAKLNAKISQTSALTNTRLRASKMGMPSTFHLVEITPIRKNLFMRLTNGGCKNNPEQQQQLRLATIQSQTVIQHEQAAFSDKPRLAASESTTAALSREQSEQAAGGDKPRQMQHSLRQQRSA